ncbi:Protein of unknown function [Bacillus wiedmannii]|nr:Protein of unknown function [Bacillus wiedmannii]
MFEFLSVVGFIVTNWTQSVDAFN